MDTSETHHLFALMYSSHAIGHVDESMLRQILEVARSKNATLGVTGILLYRQGRFYQYLEGAEANVRAVYADICEDPRHEDLQVILQTPVAERRFSEWSMGHEPLRQSQTVTPPGFRSTFDDLEATEHPEHVLRAVTELTYWYRARASRLAASADA